MVIQHYWWQHCCIAIVIDHWTCLEKSLGLTVVKYTHKKRGGETDGRLLDYIWTKQRINRDDILRKQPLYLWMITIQYHWAFPCKDTADQIPCTFHRLVGVMSFLSLPLVRCGLSNGRIPTALPGVSMFESLAHSPQKVLAPHFPCPQNTILHSSVLVVWNG
jgi:hypothetical protein